jgi:hypothetical protein
MSLEGLPVEIAERVCNYLDRNSLFQFAFVSRQCRNGAASQMNHTVFVRIRSRETFRKNCEYAYSVLTSSGRSRYVRHLRVSGFIEGNTSIQSCTRDRGYKTASRIFSNPADCERLLRLMIQLTTLRDFTWDFNDQVPSRVLRLLHASNPRIRLHMPRFCLESLLLSPKDTICIDSYELELATSPCLYSLEQIDMHDAKHQGLVDYNASAVFEVLAGGAPDLRKAKININPDRPPSGRKWQPGTIFTNSFGSTSRLEHLSITTSSYLASSAARQSDVHRMGSLQKLRTLMDFSVLRTLEIGDWLSASHMQWLTEQCQFPRLDSLSLQPWDPYNTEMETRLNTFLLSLPPLRSLTIQGRYFPS